LKSHDTIKIGGNLLLRSKKRVPSILLAVFVLCLLLSACATNNTNGDLMAMEPSQTSTAIPKGHLATPIVLNITQKPTPGPTTPAVSPTSVPTEVPPVATVLVGETPTSGGQIITPAGPETAAAAVQAVFDALNKNRVDAGLPALVWNDAIAQAAHKHNLNMVAADELSHQLPDELSPGERVQAEGINTWNVAENIGYGWGEATEAAVGLHNWMFAEQPPDDGHRQNILSSATMVGIDVVVGSNNKVWLTQDFAKY
jgi:uncharacterized protein YkwD